MAARDKPWCRVWVGGTHGVGAVEVTDYTASGLSISGGATKPYDHPDAVVCAFQVVVPDGVTLATPQLGDEVFVTGAAPDTQGVWTRLFFGLVTDLAVQQLKPDGVTVWTVNAVDPVGVLSQLLLGDEPWDQETAETRVTTSWADAVDTLLGSPWWLDFGSVTSGDVPLNAQDVEVFYRDTDAVDALSALRPVLDGMYLSVLGVWLSYDPYGSDLPNDPTTWRVVLTPSARLRPGSDTFDGTSVYRDAAEIPQEWVRYGARTLYSRETAVTDWQVTYGPANESPLVTTYSVDYPHADHDLPWFYKASKTSTAADTPSIGELIYYDGTDGSSDDEPRLRIHKTDADGYDRTLWWRGVIVARAVKVFRTAGTSGATFFVSGLQEEDTYLEMSIVSANAASYPTTTPTMSRIYATTRWPTRTVTASDTAAGAGQRRVRQLTTSVTDERYLQVMAARALDGSADLLAVTDQLTVWQTPTLDYTPTSMYPRSTKFYAVDKLWYALPHLIAGNGRRAHLYVYDPNVGKPSHLPYVALGGTLTAAEDGWVATLAVIDGAAYCGVLQPHMYHSTTLDHVALT